MFLLLINLGFWQLRRAEEKQLIVDKIDAFQQSEAVQNPSLSRYLQLFDDYQQGMHEAPLALNGEYLAVDTVLYDSRVHNGVVGYEVLSVFKPSTGETAILVNRGWIALPQMRRDLSPEIKPAKQNYAVEGKLWIPNPDLITYGNSILARNGKHILAQKIDVALLSEQLNVQLAPFVLRLSPSIEGHYVRQWRPVTAIGTSPAKHIAYAVQWFGIAAALLIIYLVSHISKRPKT